MKSYNVYVVAEVEFAATVDPDGIDVKAILPGAVDIRSPTVVQDSGVLSRYSKVVA